MASSFVGTFAICDLIKTTFGPKGMDKILQSTGRGLKVTVTNDGATILKSLHIDNPAAKVLIDISKAQDDEVGDGTTSVVVLAGELLREAEKLLTMKIHPMTIIAGYRMAAECALNSLLKKLLIIKKMLVRFDEHGQDSLELKNTIARQRSFCKIGCRCCYEAEGQYKFGIHSNYQEAWRLFDGFILR